MARDLRWTASPRIAIFLTPVPLLPFTPVLGTEGPSEEAEGTGWGWQEPPSVLESKQVMGAVGRREAAARGSHEGTAVPARAVAGVTGAPTRP